MLETIKGNCAIKEIFEKNRGLFCAKRKNIRPAVKENVEKILKERFKYYLVLYLRDWAKKKVRMIIPNIIKNIWKKKWGCENLFGLTVSLIQNHLVCEYRGKTG